MPGPISLDRLPAALRSLIGDASERERTKNEARRAELAKELRTLRAAHAKASTAHAAAVERAVALREKTYADDTAALAAVRLAVGTRDGESIAFGSQEGAKVRELRDLADPRLAEFRTWLATESDKLRHFTIDADIDTQELPSPSSRSMGTFRSPYRASSNSPSVQRRNTALRLLVEEIDVALITAGIDVGPWIEERRASIPEVQPKEIVFDNSRGVTPGRFERGAGDEPVAAAPYAGAWREPPAVPGGAVG